MSDNFINVPNGGDATFPYLQLDTEQVTNGNSIVVQRQRFSVGGTSGLALADVKNVTPSSTDYGLSVRTVGGSLVAGLDPLGVQYTTTILPTEGRNEQVVQDIFCRRVLESILIEVQATNRAQSINPYQASSAVPSVSQGGAGTYRAIAAATTNAAVIKNSPGQIIGWYLYNAAAAVRYIKFYDKVISPVVGTDMPLMTIPLPAGSAANVTFDPPVQFDFGIGIAMTTGVADTDTAALTANDCVVNIFYL